jgi:hypothetical protein
MEWWKYEAAPNDKIFFSNSYPSVINPDVVYRRLFLRSKRRQCSYHRTRTYLKEKLCSPKRNINFENASLIQINVTIAIQEYNVPKNQWWCHEDVILLVGTGCPATLKEIQLGTLYYSFNAAGNSWAWRDAGLCYVKDTVRGSERINSTSVVNASFQECQTTVTSDIANKFHLIGNPIQQMYL